MVKLLQLLGLAILSNSAQARSPNLEPLTYQSQSLTFSEWITLFTLCLAPLVAHVISGVPKIVYFAQDRPSWRQSLGLYNPTTIVWRYLAIADRRIRARNWCAADMSGSNPYFWTRRGWDGSEAMSRQSQAYCVALPTSTHAALFSASSIKTLIVTLQGMHALYLLLRNTISADYHDFSSSIALGSLFYPLAILGLVRLVACFWLTEDCAFADCEQTETTIARLTGSEQISLVSVRQYPPIKICNLSDVLNERDYHSPNIARSWIFRILYLTVILGFIVICAIYLTPDWEHQEKIAYTATSFGLVVLFLFLLVTSVVIYGYYFVRGLNTTTVLPCVASVWYQIYTGALITMMMALIIISAIQTRKSSCGFYYTTALIDMNDTCVTVQVSSTEVNTTVVI